MQFYTQSPHTNGNKLARSNTFPESDDLNAFLLAQATQFVSQNSPNIEVPTPTPQLPVYQRQHIHNKLKIQPYYSDQAVITHKVKKDPIFHENAVDDGDLDLYLNQQAEQLVRQCLGNQPTVINAQHNIPSGPRSPLLQVYQQTHKQIKEPVQQVQYVQQTPVYKPAQQVQQINQIQQAPQMHTVKPVQPVQPVQQVRQVQQIQQIHEFNHVQRPYQQVQHVQYYAPLGQVQVQQPQVQAQQVQVRQIGTPYILETGEPINIPIPQMEYERVVAAPIVRREVVVERQMAAPQRQQARVVNKSPEPNQSNQSNQPNNLQFIQKGPKGEVLYKSVEGGQTFYIKRGLTVEAINNYNLAHLIGVGPPVEFIGNDGIKMEEGINLRHAVRDKIISMDEVRNQIQGLHKTLFDTGMAHCDVKFENCLYFPKYKKVLLIDNGDLAVYGNRRRIKTPGANSTLLIHGNEERNRVGPATDLRGFMHIMKNATEEDINVAQ